MTTSVNISYHNANHHLSPTISANIAQRGLHIRQFQSSGKDLMFNDPNNLKRSTHISGPYLGGNGFLKNEKWEVISVANCAHFSYENNKEKETYEKFPYDFRMRSLIGLFENGLQQDIYLINTCIKPYNMDIGVNLHLPWEKGMLIEGFNDHKYLDIGQHGNYTIGMFHRESLADAVKRNWLSFSGANRFVFHYPSGYSLKVNAHFNVSRNTHSTFSPRSFEIFSDPSEGDFISLKPVITGEVLTSKPKTELKPLEGIHYTVILKYYNK